jgi:hypothetical protein
MRQQPMGQLETVLASRVWKEVLVFVRFPKKGKRFFVPINKVK